VDSGVNPQTTAATTNNLRFAGQYDDSETGLHHNGLRDYDPTTGRYLQTDPIGLAGGLNTYAYVEGDPVNLIDPTGENPAALLYVYARCVAQCTAQSAAGDFLDNKCPEFGDYAKDCALSCANPLNWLGGRGGPGRVGARGPGRGAGPPPVRGPQQRIEAPDIGKNLAGGPGTNNFAGGPGTNKTGPKPAGQGPHNEKITEIANRELKNNPGSEIIAGGGRERERLIATPGGNKEGRRPDIIIRNPDGTLRGINVGLTDKNGIPIRREIEALQDLNTKSPIPTTFESYQRARRR
jgi:RHS repeat-associated protein